MVATIAKQQTSGLRPYDKQVASEMAKRSHAPNNKRKIPSRMQAIEIQHALHRAIRALDKDIPQCEESEARARVATALASVAKGWQSMTAQLRVLDGRPSPGTLSPAERRAKAASKASPERDDPRPIKPTPGA